MKISKNLKLTVTIILILTLCLSLFAGCGEGTQSPQPPTENPTPEPVKSFMASFFKGDGATGDDFTLKDLILDSIFKLPANSFTRSGYKFTGWWDGTNQWQPGDQIQITGDTSFVATWKRLGGGGGGGGGGSSTPTPPQTTLSSPTISVSDGKITWNNIPNATGYQISVNGTEETASSPYVLSYTGVKEIKVKAVGNGTTTFDSSYSSPISAASSFSASDTVTTDTLYILDAITTNSKITLNSSRDLFSIEKGSAIASISTTSDLKILAPNSHVENDVPMNLGNLVLSVASETFNSTEMIIISENATLSILKGSLELTDKISAPTIIADSSNAPVKVTIKNETMPVPKIMVATVGSSAHNSNIIVDTTEPVDISSNTTAPVSVNVSKNGAKVTTKSKTGKSIAQVDVSAPNVILENQATISGQVNVESSATAANIINLSDTEIKLKTNASDTLLAGSFGKANDQTSDLPLPKSILQLGGITAPSTIDYNGITEVTLSGTVNYSYGNNSAASNMPEGLSIVDSQGLVVDFTKGKMTTADFGYHKKVYIDAKLLGEGSENWILILPDLYVTVTKKLLDFSNSTLAVSDKKSTETLELSDLTFGSLPEIPEGLTLEKSILTYDHNKTYYDNTQTNYMKDSTGLVQAALHLSGSAAHNYVLKGAQNQGDFIKFDANYNVIGSHHQVTLKLNNPQTTSFTYVVRGEQLTEPTQPTFEGYTFQGWFTDQTLETPATFPMTVENDSTILYAKWDQIKATLILNSNGGTEYENITYNKGDSVSSPTPPTKANHTFAGWFLDQSLTNEVTFPYTINSDTTLYAKWEPIIVTLTFDSKGGSTISPTSHNQGTSIESLPTPTRTGYSFVGWFDESLTNQVTFPYIINSDTTLYAKWSFSEPGSTFLKYELINSGTAYRVTGVNIDEKSVTKVVIPESHNEKPVTEIKAQAFSNQTFSKFSNLTSVHIPDSVEVIGEGAFEHCGSLTSITIGNSVQAIKEMALNGCKKLANIVIPDSVTTIGNLAFVNCENFTSIAIPAGVTAIGNSAFAACRNLANITVAEKNTSFKSVDGSLYTKDGTVLMRCAGGKESNTFDIPASVTKIDDYAFESCYNLTSIIIPEGVKTIGNDAFLNCRNLKTITISASVTSIGDGIFASCGNLTSITIAEGNTVFKSIDGNLYSKDGTTLIQYAVGKPETSFVIPNGVTAIGTHSFDYCMALTEITIPEGVETIGNSAFFNCYNLQTINIPSSVTVIEEEAFSNCRGLLTVSVSSENGNFTTIDGNLYSKDATKFIQYAVGKSETTFEIPGSVTTIGNDAFFNSKLVTVFIPSSVTTIVKTPFYGCSSLTINCEATSQPSGWDYIWNYDNCPVNWGVVPVTSNATYDYVIQNNKAILTKYKGNATEVSIPSTIDEVDVVGFSGAFTGNTTMQSVTIPEGVTSIGNGAFSGCTSLTNVTIPSSITAIGKKAFSNGTSLTNITIPENVASIGDWAFENCRALESIALPNSVISIGNFVFSGCDSLTSVTLPNEITFISDMMFSSCHKLTSVIIPNTVTSIGRYAFDHCNSLISVTIPSSVTLISDYAFRDCTNLTTIEIPSSVTAIGYNAFDGCANLTINCEATSQPLNWSSEWNPDNRPVNWSVTIN